MTWDERRKPGKTCYCFINYEPPGVARTDHYCCCCCSFSCKSPCDIMISPNRRTKLMQNECSPSKADVGQCNSRRDCGQMSRISKSRMRSHGGDETRFASLPQQQGRHNLTKTRPRLLVRSRRSVGFIHSFIMLTLLNLILLLYHLEAPQLLVTGNGGGGGGHRNGPVLLFAQAEESESMIELRRFLVPAQVRPGELRRLACQYELHGATLHAMKLFKDDREFYRYTPGNPPSDQRLVFQAAGVQVDMNRSGEREVWLKINKRSTGQYKCQVTIEGKFISVSAEKRMEVITGTGSVTGTDQSASGGAQTGGSGMWRHHTATPGGSRLAPPPTYLNQDQLSVRRPPGEMYGLNTVMQSSSSASVVHRPSPILCACLLTLTGCSLLMAARTRLRAS